MEILAGASCFESCKVMIEKYAVVNGMAILTERAGNTTK
jgi:hypothetical protein